MKSAWFHGWNPPDFMDEIHQISWNLPDFICKWGNLHMKSAGFQGLKSAGFHDEIRRISCMKSARFHDEIHQISWNLLDFRAWNSPDFMKFAGFHEIRRISCISQMSQGPMVLFLLIAAMIAGNCFTPWHTRIAQQDIRMNLVPINHCTGLGVICSPPSAQCTQPSAKDPW